MNDIIYMNDIILQLQREYTNLEQYIHDEGDTMTDRESATINNQLNVLRVTIINLKRLL